MFFENRLSDTQPLTRIGNMPVYGTTIVVAAMVDGMIVSAFFGLAASVEMFAFVPQWFWKQGHVWRAVSYLIVGQVNFFTIFSLMFFYSFGRDCELEMGRGRYFGFLGVLIAAPVVFGIPMKLVAFGSMFLAAVGDVSQRDYMGLACTLATCAASFGYIRAMRAGTFEGFSFSAFFRRRPGLRVLPSAGVSVRTVRQKGEVDDLDFLLEKIARSGLGSLSAKERKQLEAGREKLLKKDRR
jgi:hypothetical protein